MRQEPFIPFAVWYTGGRTRATMVRPPATEAPQSWRKDLETIRNCGFNAVRCWVDWASGEPQPGDYDFEALDLLISLAEEVGLKVIIQVYLDSAPDWLVKHYPDCRYVSADGVPIDSQGAPGYCYDHPGVRSAAERFLTTLATHVTARPNFYAWDLWSEPHIVQWGYFDFLPQPAVFCYCHHTTQRFRDWLQRKYGGDLAALNAAWYRQFSSWDVVLPPKFISLMSYTDYLDWLQFILEKLAQDLRWRHEVIRRVDHHITTSHSAVPSILTLPIDEQGSPDDWLMARSVDIWGTSLYPKHVGARETHDPSFRSAMLTSTRSACDANNAPYWLGELQGGHGYVGMFASPMTEADARSYTWHSLAHGAKGLCFYAWHPMSSGYESAGFGLAHLDGTPSDRAIAAGAIARMVGQRMELFYRGKPPQAQAAICWDVYANMMWTCMRQPWHYIPSRSYIGAYRALYQAHVPADFVHVDEIAAGKLQRYRALYLPFAFMLTRQAAEQIEAFVAQGGMVLAEARTAWNNEKGYCDLAVPGFGLEQLFGCRERGTQGVDENTPVPIRIVRQHPVFPFLRANDVLNGSRFREALEPLADDATVIGEFEDGSPAIVVHRYGQGWAIFVGTLLSLAFYRFQDANAGKLLRGLLQAAGVEPPVKVTGVPEGVDIEPRLLKGTDDNGRPYVIFFAFNHTTREIEAGFELKAPADRCEVTDLVTGEAVVHRIEEERLILRRRLGSTEIWVAKITTS